MQPRGPSTADQHYVDLLGKLKTIQRVRQSANVVPGTPAELFSAKAQNAMMMGGARAGAGAGAASKRQGAWSYDYGLGGGRFGKRNYGDYGIGGGRFGRSLDHVDTGDVADSDMTL